MQSPNFLVGALFLIVYAYIGWNLYYFGARYYDHALGRWTGVDPMVSRRPGLSPYNYAQNNFMIRVDPNGMQDKSLWQTISDLILSGLNVNLGKGDETQKQESDSPWHGGIEEESNNDEGAFLPKYSLKNFEGSGSEFSTTENSSETEASIPAIPFGGNIMWDSKSNGHGIIGGGASVGVGLGVSHNSTNQVFMFRIK